MSFGPSMCGQLMSLAQSGRLRTGQRLGLLGAPKVLASACPQALSALAKALASPQPDTPGGAKLFADCAGGDAADILSRMGLDCRPLGPQPERDSSDLVANFGISEHLFDQNRAFATMHEAVRPGGLLVHAVPGGGYAGHGYFRYPLGLFQRLAAANGYAVVSLSTTPHKPSSQLGFGWSDRVKVDAGLADAPSWLSLAVFEKTTPNPFICPEGLDTVAFWSRKLALAAKENLCLSLPSLHGPQASQILTDASLIEAFLQAGLLRFDQLRLLRDEQSKPDTLSATLEVCATRTAKAFDATALS